MSKDTGGRMNKDDPGMVIAALMLLIGWPVLIPLMLIFGILEEIGFAIERWKHRRRS